MRPSTLPAPGRENVGKDVAEQIEGEDKHPDDERGIENECWMVPDIRRVLRVVGDHDAEARPGQRNADAQEGQPDLGCARCAQRDGYDDDDQVA